MSTPQMPSLRTLILAGGLTAMALASATPAAADPYRGYRRGGDTTGAAIAGGIVGLAVGAAIASSGRHDRYDRYYDGPRHPRYRTYYVYRDYPAYYGRDWNRYRWERERWERRRWQNHGGWGRDWHRGGPRYRDWDGPRGW